MPSPSPPRPLPARLPRLGIFPLPSAQLFPHTVLPLHVFEPRYRALTRDCLAGSRLMAVALLRPGYEERYQERPEVHLVCGVGEIVDHRRYPDGRYDILLRGIGRVRITRELPPDEPYRLVEAERLDEPPAEGPQVHAAHRALLALCDRLAIALPEGGDTLRSLARQEDDPGACADVLCAALLTEADERQSALESLDPLARLDRATGAAALLLDRFTPRAPN